MGKGGRPKGQTNSKPLSAETGDLVRECLEMVHELACIRQERTDILGDRGDPPDYIIAPHHLHHLRLIGGGYE